LDYDSYCYIPFHGITVESNTGNLTFCCQDNSRIATNIGGERIKPAMNISDVDDLQDWWAEEFQDVWDAYDRGEQRDFYPCNTCFGSKRTSNNTVFESYRDNLNQGTYSWKWKRGGENKIRFLELAASNICNQMCVMCSGRHSNQWLEHDYLFDRADKYQLWRFSKEDAAKIHKVIPDLDVLYMKGGDPLADQMHIDFLQTAAKTNPDCTINLQTNMQGLRKRDLPIFEKLNNLRPMVSVDGTGDIYNWIRGGDWDKITRNMEILYGETGIRSQIMITISLYNFWSIDRIFEYFYDKPYTRWMQCHNIVSHPRWCSHLYLPPNVVEDQLIKLMPIEHYYSRRTTFRDFFDPRSYYQENNYKEWLHSVWKYTDRMNKIRGYDILDHVPELRKILQAI